jgi:anti-sigma regulatory factor (Ser/Thr protein kinase)
MVRVWGCDDPLQIAALLTSELVTNAVRHAAETIWVALELEPDSLLVVQASDDLPGEPVVKPPSADADGGRGMFLVDQLARRWGVHPTEAGKVVWFEVAVAGCPSDSDPAEDDGA